MTNNTQARYIMMTRFLYIIMIAFLSIGAQAQTTLKTSTDLGTLTEPIPDLFSGVWINDRDSAVTLTVSDGLLSGHYQTALGQPDKSQKFPVTGFVSGDQITFTVNFKTYGSMTSWTGQITRDDQGDYIRTLWHLTRDVPDDQEEADLWQSITSGASEFRRAVR